MISTGKNMICKLLYIKVCQNENYLKNPYKYDNMILKKNAEKFQRPNRLQVAQKRKIFDWSRRFAGIRKAEVLMKTKKIRNGIKACIPLWSAIFIGIFAAALIVKAISQENAVFADAINDTSGVVIRTVLSSLTSWIPFSVAETLLLFSPVLIVLMIAATVRRGKHSAAAAVRYLVSLLSVCALVYSVFIFGYGTGYYGKTIDEKLSIERRNVSAEELYDTAIALMEKAEAELPGVFYPQGTYSAMKFDYFEMNDKLNTAYNTLCDRYPSFQRLHSQTKPVMLSEPWTYTHTSGVYCFFTGEANVNVNYPDYIVVSSAAHEMAHQRGITREDEANFVAFLVCTMSDDAYVRYCGYTDVLNEVMNKLYSANYDLWVQARSRMPEEIKREYTSYSQFFDKYRENKVADVSTSINNAYISSHGQPAGIRSYGLVVDLVVSYMLEGADAE